MTAFICGALVMLVALIAVFFIIVVTDIGAGK